MPVRIDVHAGQRLFVSRPHGTIRAVEGHHAWSEIFERLGTLAGWQVVVDHRGAIDYQISFQEMQVMVRRHIEAVRAGTAPDKVAEYAPGEIAFGMARMFELTAAANAPGDVATFSEIEPMALWLGRDAARLRRLLGERLLDAPDAAAG